MKRFLCAVVLCLATLGAIAQVTIPRMQLLPSGFVGPDTTKNYLVIEMPKVSKVDLYKRTLTYINNLYNNPQAVVNAVDGESITVNASTEALRGFNESYKYPMRYNVVIEFREGKIKFSPQVTELSEVWVAGEAPHKIYISSENSQSKVELSCVWLIRKSGERVLLKPELKASLDSWVNNYIAGIVSKVNDTW
jgi:hypothetical protein